MKSKRRESGAFAIETVLSLTFFMVAVIALMMVSMIIRTQAAMQYALNQTAKEVSGYYYLVDKLGLARALSGESSDAISKKLEQTDKTVAQIVNFSSDAGDTIGDVNAIKDKFNSGKKVTWDDFEKIKDDADALKGKAAELGKDLEKYTKNSKEDNISMLKAVIEVFGRSLASRAFSKYVGGYVCKALMPKYLPGDNLGDFYKSAGIIPKSVNFDNTELLLDGRSIKLVVTYKVDAGKMTLGVINKELTFCQVAATAAWVHSDSEEGYKGDSWGKLNSLDELSKKLVTKPYEKPAETTADGAVTGITSAAAVTSENSVTGESVTEAPVTDVPEMSEITSEIITEDE